MYNPIDTIYILFDNDSISKLHAGDETVFKKIFKQCYLPVRSFTWRFVKDNDIAEDIVQDAFLQVWEKRTSFNVLAEIKSFLYVSVRNACLDHLKHERVKQKNAIDIAIFMSHEMEQEAILEEDVDSLIHNAIKTLPPQAQKIVIMTMDGNSNMEIAEKLNITVNTVKSTKLKAYRILRKRLRNLQWLLALLLT
ncbi:RNA polymerase sigma-70 factor [Butyricimonas sp.]|uniref:RNA polymerase sigma-70 factor n=1 Tax=Butyricimonas sp. TaxID=1969738 RepID=UPI0025BAE176|nr:RNA polymerase sigma-70 factor [Butyricimonas sp.]